MPRAVAIIYRSVTLDIEFKLFEYMVSKVENEIQLHP